MIILSTAYGAVSRALVWTDLCLMARRFSTFVVQPLEAGSRRFLPPLLAEAKFGQPLSIKGLLGVRRLYSVWSWMRKGCRRSLHLGRCEGVHLWHSSRWRYAHIRQVDECFASHSSFGPQSFSSHIKYYT